MAKRCQKRTLRAPIGKADRTPSPKRLVWLLLGDPENMEATERGALDEMLKASADVAMIYPLIQKFKKMIKNTNSKGQVERFDGWLKAALSSGGKDFETFALGLRREQSGVEAALILPYSNGQTEGQINRLKLIKGSPLLLVQQSSLDADMKQMTRKALFAVLFSTHNRSQSVSN